MNKYIITFDSGAPYYKCGEKRIVNGDSPADAVLKLMKTVRVNCVVKIKKAHLEIKEVI